MGILDSLKKLFGGGGQAAEQSAPEAPAEQSAPEAPAEQSAPAESGGSDEEKVV